MKRAGSCFDEFCKCVVWIVVVHGAWCDKLVLDKHRRRHLTLVENVEAYFSGAPLPTPVVPVAIWAFEF